MCFRFTRRKGNESRPARSRSVIREDESDCGLIDRTPSSAFPAGSPSTASRPGPVSPRCCSPAPWCKLVQRIPKERWLTRPGRLRTWRRRCAMRWLPQASCGPPRPSSARIARPRSQLFSSALDSRAPRAGFSVPPPPWPWPSAHRLARRRQCHAGSASQAEQNGRQPLA